MPFIDATRGKAGNCILRQAPLVAALDGPLPDLRLALAGRAGSDDGDAAADVARAHAPTLRTLHVATLPLTSFGPGIWAATLVVDCFPAERMASGLAEGYARMAPDSGQQSSAAEPRLGALSLESVRLVLDSAPGRVLPELTELVGLLRGMYATSSDDGPVDCDVSVTHLPLASIALAHRAGEVLGRFPGPFRTVTLVDISPDLFDALPSQFPCLKALRVVDHVVIRRPERALELARAVRRMASLRDLRWTNPTECVLQELAGFRGLREAVVFLPEGSNAWMARVPGLLGGVEALEVVARRRGGWVVCLDPTLRLPNVCRLVADLLSSRWHLETLVLLCATHNKSVRALANVYDSAGASLCSGACRVSLELLPGGHITPEAMPQCRGLLRSLSEIKGTCSTLQVVAPLCSQQLKEVWILDDDETGRSDNCVTGG
eukprot:m51a1_g4664 hypothetical protein (434) ;mRNA; f:98509-100080